MTHSTKTPKLKYYATRPTSKHTRHIIATVRAIDLESARCEVHEQMKGKSEWELDEWEKSGKRMFLCA